MAATFRCRCSTSTRSPPAAERSRGSMARARCKSGRRAPAPIRARCAMVKVVTSRRLPTPTSCSARFRKRSPIAGGTLRLDRAAAEKAIRERIAEPLGISAIAAARGIVEIVGVKMQEAIKGSVVQSRLRPARFSLARLQRRRRRHPRGEDGARTRYARRSGTGISRRDRARSASPALRRASTTASSRSSRR